MSSRRKRKLNQRTQPAKRLKSGQPSIGTENDEKRNRPYDFRETSTSAGEAKEAWWNQSVITEYLKDKSTSKIKLVNFEASVERETSIDETSPYCLRYRTPTFSASATVRMAPMADKEKWKVGWIQACDVRMTRNTYGDDGYTSWEFPDELDFKKTMYNDSDGRHYPWTGEDEFAIFEGPSGWYQSRTIQTRDIPSSNVAWSSPTRPARPALTAISRRQSFNVWLVAWCMTTNKAYILKNVHWGLSVTIDVDPNMPRGHRAKLVGDHTPVQPTEWYDVPIPRCALLPPNTNSAQMLVWRPTVGQPTCIIRPAWEKEHVKYDVSRLCRL